MKDHDDFQSVTYKRIRNLLPSDLLPEVLLTAFEDFEAREKKRVVQLGDGHGNRTEPGDEQFREDAKLVLQIIKDNLDEVLTADLSALSAVYSRKVASNGQVYACEVLQSPRANRQLYVVRCRFRLAHRRVLSVQAGRGNH